MFCIWQVEDERWDPKARDLHSKLSFLLYSSHGALGELVNLKSLRQPGAYNNIRADLKITRYNLAQCWHKTGAQ